MGSNPEKNQNLRIGDPAHLSNQEICNRTVFPQIGPRILKTLSVNIIALNSDSRQLAISEIF